jgi:hypothetical protein
MDMKRFFLYAISIAALALAGCGGGGGTSGPSLQDQLTDAMADLETAEGERDAARMALEAVRMALSVMTDAEIEGAIMALDADSAALAAVASELGMTGATQAVLVAEIQRLQAEDADPVADAGAMALAPVIADPKASGTPGGNLSGYDGLTLPIMAVNAGGEIRVETGDNANASDPTDDTLGKGDMGIADKSKEFGMMNYPRPTRRDFEGSVHQRTIDKVTDTLTIYSDAKPNADETYQMYYQQTAQVARDGVASIDDMDAGNVITFEMDVSDIGMYIDASGFPVGDRQNIVFTDNMVTTTVDESEPSLTGTFRGIPGKFACASGCEAMNDMDSNLATLTGTWTFTPTALEAGDPAYMVSSVIPDADYLAFGYWMEATEQADGSTKTKIRPFSMGSEAYAGMYSSLAGTANYTGAAAGQFVKKEGPVESAVPTSSGHFTADVSMTARFGGTAIAEDDHFELDGNVTNFADGQGNSIDSLWRVDLTKTDIGQDGAVTDGVATGNGSWSATFYGAPAADVGQVDATDDYPTGVAGEFNAHFGNGHVVGGYGATR